MKVRRCPAYDRDNKVTPLDMRGMKEENMEPTNEKPSLSSNGGTSASTIDAAINKAKARQAARNGQNNAELSNTSGRPRLTAEQKKERETARAAAKLLQKQAREQARAARQAERAALREPAHMAKVLKAAAQLPPLAGAETIFGEATTELNDSEITALAAHLSHFLRLQQTRRALSTTFKVGDTVRIASGNPRFIGLVGTVQKAQRIRMYVEVAGHKKPVYVFTSDCTLVQEPVQEFLSEVAKGNPSLSKTA